MSFQKELIDFPELEAINMNGGRYYRVPPLLPTTSDLFYPSVTTVLGRRPEKQAALAKWRERVGEEEANRTTRTAGARGTVIHELMENYVLQDELPDPSVMPFNRVLFGQLRRALDSHLSIVRAMEVPLYSHEMRVAGRSDLIGLWDGIPSVIDFKTSGKAKEEWMIEDYFLQATAYSIMFQKLQNVIKIPQIVILIACDQLLEAQVFVKRRSTYIRPLLEVVHADHLCHNPEFAVDFPLLGSR